MVTWAGPMLCAEGGKMGKSVINLKVLTTWVCNCLIRSKCDRSERG